MGAADEYGDDKFTAMMMAKVICVQLVSMLRFNFLFQDVDVVWYKNPLRYFLNPNKSLLTANSFDVWRGWYWSSTSTEGQAPARQTRAQAA